MLTAADDGVGVDAQTLERLFERFYRADAARTTRGTGLGLAIVKHVVTAAGGEVEARRHARARAAHPLHVPGVIGPARRPRFHREEEAGPQLEPSL